MGTSSHEGTDSSELESIRHIRSVLDSLPALISHVGQDLRYRYVNAAYECWFRIEDAVGRSVREVLGDEAFEAIRPHIETVLAGQSVAYEGWAPYRAGGTRYIRASYVPCRGAGGQPDGYVSLVEDITASKLAEERLTFLAEVSDIFAQASLDYEGTLSAATRLAIPRLSDLAAVELLTAEGTLEQVAIAHVDPEKAKVAREVRRRYPPDPKDEGGLWRVLRTGEPQLVSAVNDGMLVAGAKDADHLAMLRAMGVGSVIMVPIAIRGRALGVLVLVSAVRRFETADLALAQLLAARAALAIDNARLFREANEATRRKDEFLAMLGHELRNPLAPITTALEVMRLRGEASSAREQEVIARQVTYLSRLVDDLLDVSRITRGKIALHKEMVEIATVVAKAIEMASPLFEQKAQVLSIQVPREGLTADGDPLRLSQVFANLLTNAAKYTEAGGKVTLRAERTGEAISVEVSDTGIGIPPEMLPRIFDLFVQGPQSLDRAQGGLGIGLMLARSLVEMHGGTIEAHSDGRGQGSRFVVRLPALARVAVADGREGTYGLRRPSRSRRLLVVDDNPDAVSTLSDALRIAGHEVIEAQDGPEALGKCEQFRPDAAILDIGLPVMDGYELARRLREQLPGLQLLAVTGYGLESDVRRSQAAGFARHFVKPLDLGTLLSALEE